MSRSWEIPVKLPYEATVHMVKVELKSGELYGTHGAMTCLSEGKGFHFPPFHILNIHGFQILFDCSLDLSALSAFSPLSPNFPTSPDECKSSCQCGASSHLKPELSAKEKIGKPLDESSLIRSEPWYKTVMSLKLWNTSFIDVVLICSPRGMLGLPFLTRDKYFAATVYATQATARIGQLMMGELVTMHREIRQFYGPEEPSPEWLKWGEIELLPSVLKEILIGRDGGDLGGWIPLYSAADVNDCMQTVQALKFAEKACYNGTLLLKSFSSGLDIGTCNWNIISLKQNISYLSGSIFASDIAMEFDYHALQGSDVIFFSDFAASDLVCEDNLNGSSAADKHPPNVSEKDAGEGIPELLLNDDEFTESKKFAFLCSWALKSVNAGGSVLVPISQLGFMLQLLEHITFSLQSSDLKVPIYIISSVAEELLAFLNVIPEWLCKQWCLEAVPCSWHQIGPAVHLLQRWCWEGNSLLILEEGIDANLACLPFNSVAMKVLQYLFVINHSSWSPWLQKAESLLKFLNPKYVLGEFEVGRSPQQLSKFQKDILNFQWPYLVC